MLSLDNIWKDIKPRILGMLGVPTAYTPTWTAPTANPAIGNGTLVGKYILIGKMCHVWIKMTAGSTTTFGTGAWSFGLPFPADASSVWAVGLADIRDAGANNYARLVLLSTDRAQSFSTIRQLDSATNSNSIDATTPFTWGSGDGINMDLWYEVE